MKPILTLVVPCYNSQDYLERCLDSLLLPTASDVEVVVVNDGSTDRTAEIAEAYRGSFPDRVRVIHKQNGGHGSGINAGLAVAKGVFFKVVDSDDWLDQPSFHQVLAVLRTMVDKDRSLDLLIANFVYEKEGKRVKRVVNYRRALPRGRVFGWDEVGSFRTWQYLLMHSIVYRTELLRKCQLQVPERSFYVDNYFTFVPLPHVRTLFYLDVDLYRYHIGREDQSVNEQVMIERIDQQLHINRLMLEHLAQVRRQESLPTGLEQYLVRYAALVTMVSSVLLVRASTPAARAKKSDLWTGIRELDPGLDRRLRQTTAGAIGAGTSPIARIAMHVGYDVARLVVGFN